MKKLWLGLLIRVFLLCSVSAYAQSARDYYNEIYKAGGLDRMADGYVCFDNDQELKTFFIFGKSEVLKQFLIAARQYKTLPKSQQDALNRGFLNARGYDRGIPLSSEDTYSKDGNSWRTDPFTIQGSKMQERLDIEWSTLRYKRTVEILNPNGTLRAVAATRYGRCEAVSPEVPQKGNP